MLQRRLMVAAAVLVLWVVGIEARLLVLQIVQHDDLVARAERQQMSTVPAPAKRGEIFDRHGRLLAYSVDADTIYAVPTEISDPEKTAAALCAALDDCTRKSREELTERLSQPRAFAYVKRRATPMQAKRVLALDLDGIGFRKESKRFYPNRELAANLLGYVGVDNVGLAGIEATYDKTVRGREGKLLVQTDARRHVFSRLERSPTNALSIARLRILPRILLSRTLVGGHLNPLRVFVGDEREIGIRKGRIHLPVHASGERRPGRIGTIDDHQLARPRLVALLDPDLPVDVRFAECEMVRRHAIDGRGSNLIS